MPRTIWPNEVVREVELTERRMLLDSLANSDTASDHSLVIGKVEDEQVSLITKDCGDGQGTLHTDVTIGKMQVGQRLIVLDA